jgi:DnaJ-class molecular chaperone
VSNLYAVLNVPADADRTTVRASFRTLALRFHPDHGGDAQRMEAVIDAWAILGHPERRAAYDLTLGLSNEGRCAAGRPTGPSRRPRWWRRQGPTP